MKSKTIRNLVILALLPVFMWTCSSCSKVPAGNVGVKVYLLGGDKGVDSEELGVGRYWIGVNEELYLFPTFTQNYVWTRDKAEGSPEDESITFQTQEGLTVGADVGISYYINAEKVSVIFQKYRRGVGEITDIYLRNMVRDAFNSVGSKYPVEYVYGVGKSTLLDSVQSVVKNQVESIGIVIEKIYIIGSLRLPKPVTDALSRKVEATQKAEQRENEIRQAEAEAQKTIAIARGDSAAVVIRAQSEAEALRLKLKYINSTLVQHEAIKKWNGTLPNVSGGAVPFINIDTKK